MNEDRRASYRRWQAEQMRPMSEQEMAEVRERQARDAGFSSYAEAMRPAGVSVQMEKRNGS
jgi:hypothetical protein